MPDAAKLNGGVSRILKLEIQPCGTAAGESHPVPDLAQGKVLPG
ncbi:MAG: hypothetical protein ACRER4_00465 [Steroidobacteraceae bacterium]